MAKLALCGGTSVRTKPWPKWPMADEREEEQILSVLRSGRWGGVEGDKRAEFEAAFARYQGARRCVGVANGTVAIEIGLRACGVEAGKEVIIPPYTFIATATAVLSVKAKPVWADIEPDTFQIDPKAVEAAITPRTAAIIPVHVAGNPCDMDALLAIAQRHSLAVIEDAAQAHGSKYKGRGLGAIGDCGTFSFQSSKNMTAGEGGAILTDRDDVADLAWSLQNCGRSVGGGWYEHPLMGTNCRMTEWQAAILLAQLARMPELQARRVDNANYLAGRLSEIEGIRPAKIHGEEEGSVSSVHLFLVRYDPAAFGNVPKPRLIEALRAEGIMVGPGYQPLYNNSMFERICGGRSYVERYVGIELDYSRVQCPVTEEIVEKGGFWLTQFHFLAAREDMDDIVEAIGKVQRYHEELMTDDR